MKLGKATALLLVIALILTGCFLQKQDQSKTDTVGILTRDLMHDTVELVRTNALQDGLTAAGYTVQLLDAKADQSIQTQQLQTLLEQGCKGVIIDPVMVTAAPELVGLAKEKDVPLIFTGSQSPEEALRLWDKVCFVGADGEQPGLQQGNILAGTPDQGDINGDGLLSYILIRDEGNFTDTQLHIAGVLTALTDAEVALTELKLCDAGGDREKAKQICAVLLAEYGKDIEAVICTNDAMALGAQEAIADGGRTVNEDVYLVGLGGAEEAISAIAEGKLTGTVREDTQALTQQVCNLLNQLQTGAAEKQVYYVNCIAVSATVK